MSRLSLLALAFLLACGFLACGGDDPDPVAELEARGPHEVGFTELEVTYARPDGRGDRTVKLYVWYPATTTEGLRVPTYPFATATAAIEAPVAEGVFPVLGYSHGHQAVPLVSTFVFEHFASHGWLVFAPEHTGNTTVDGEDRQTEIYYLRGHDVSESYDHLLALPESSPLAGHVSERAVIAGHSFGGYTVYGLAGATYDVDFIETGCPAGDVSADICDELDDEALEQLAAGVRDPRFVAAIPMASGDFGLFGTEGVRAIEIPVLHMVAEGDGHPAGSANEDQYWSALDGVDDMRIDFLGAGHNSFTDVCRRLPGSELLRCPTDRTAMDALAWQRATNVYALAFARAHLLGDRRMARFLEDAEPVDPSAEIDRR